MGKYSRELHAVVCDVEGCFESNDTGHPEGGYSSEGDAEHAALRDGWKLVDGKWTCPEHEESD